MHGLLSRSVELSSGFVGLLSRFVELPSRFLGLALKVVRGLVIHNGWWAGLEGKGEERGRLLIL